jgi:hypothetical protein
MLLLQAFVTTTNSKGCFVRLSRMLNGRYSLRMYGCPSNKPRMNAFRVMLKDLADAFVKQPAKLFAPGRLVVGTSPQAHAPSLALLSVCA